MRRRQEVLREQPEARGRENCPRCRLRRLSHPPLTWQLTAARGRGDTVSGERATLRPKPWILCCQEDKDGSTTFLHRAAPKLVCPESIIPKIVTFELAFLCAFEMLGVSRAVMAHSFNPSTWQTGGSVSSRPA